MRVRCKACGGSGSVEQPDVETHTVEGISYKVMRTKDGSYVQTPCHCFGSRMRACSSMDCPWRKQRNGARL